MPYTPQDFIRLNEGEFMDFDGSYGAQCVDLFNYYKKQVVGGGWMGTPDTGGAADLWNDFAGDGAQYFDKIPNTETSVPEYGDVIIWEANCPGITGPAGHVGIFVSGDVNSLDVFNQNYPNNSPCHVQHFANYAGVLGYLRPKSWLVPPPPPPLPPAPEPAPEPAPSQSTPEVPVAPDDAESHPVPVEAGSDDSLPVSAIPAPELPEPDPSPVPSPVPSSESVDSTTSLTPPAVTPHTVVMDSILHRLTSRKLWVAVAAVITLVLNNQFDQAVIVVLGYLGVQGFVDASR